MPVGVNTADDLLFHIVLHTCGELSVDKIQQKIP